MTATKETKEVIKNHSDYLPLITGLEAKGFKPIGNFQYKDFIFESFLKDKIVWIQKDVNGRSLTVFQQINKTQVIDILESIETDKREVVLKKRHNFLTRFIDWLTKAELVFYGK